MEKVAGAQGTDSIVGRFFARSLSKIIMANLLTWRSWLSTVECSGGPRDGFVLDAEKTKRPSGHTASQNIGMCLRKREI